MGKIMYKNVNYSGSSSGGGVSGIELTQAEYDALVAAGTVKHDVMYFITDGELFDEETFYKEVFVEENLFGGRFLVRSKGGFCKISKVAFPTNNLVSGTKYDMCTLPEELRPTSNRYVPSRWMYGSGSDVTFYDVYLEIIAETGVITIIPFTNVPSNRNTYLEIEWFSREWS